MFLLCSFFCFEDTLNIDSLSFQICIRWVSYDKEASRPDDRAVLDPSAGV